MRYSERADAVIIRAVFEQIELESILTKLVCKDGENNRAASDDSRNGSNLGVWELGRAFTVAQRQNEIWNLVGVDRFTRIVPGG